jgi:hypothetical protein
MPAIKIATFNINGIGSRIGALRRWLEREAPDGLPAGTEDRRRGRSRARTA